MGESKQAAVAEMMQTSETQAPKHTGTVCFFVSTDTAPADGEGRARAAAVADTWAKHPAVGSHVYYFVDEAMQPYHLPASVNSDQIIKTLRADYNDLPMRTRQLLVQVNTQPLLDRCAWFAFVDDDTYVNTANIVAKVRLLNASAPHYMGPVYKYSVPGDTGLFVHGDFKMFSVAAVPKMSEVAARCRLWEPGWEDVEIERCLKYLGFDKALPAERFGTWVHDNTHRERPQTLRRALIMAATSQKPLACFDILHKMLAEDMRELHTRLQGSPTCSQRSASLPSISVLAPSPREHRPFPSSGG